MEILKCNLDDEKKNIIKNIIKDSFKQKNESKTSYTHDQLNQFYPNEMWMQFIYLKLKVCLELGVLMEVNCIANIKII